MNEVNNEGYDLNTNNIQFQNNYKQSNISDNKNKLSKGNIILLILLFLLLGIICFIIYDKIIKKETPRQNKVEIRELSKYNTNQFSEIRDEIIDGIECKTITYINNDLKIDFRFYAVFEDTDNIGPGELYADMIINANEESNLYYLGKINIGAELVEEFNNFKSLENALIKAINSLKENMGTIKGDKNYLYFLEIDDKVIFINKFGKILDNENNNTNYLIRSQNYLSLADDCKLINYLSLKDDEIKHFLYKITDDTLYYIINNEEEKLEEYKLTINNNQINVENINTCTQAE